MKAISLDLRERVAAAWDAGQTRVRIAERFDVSKSWVGKLLSRRRETGSLGAKPHGGGRGRLKLGLASLGRLKGLVDDKPDASLGELRDGLEASGGPAVSEAAVCRALGPAGMDLPLKKKLGRQSRLKQFVFQLLQVFGGVAPEAAA